MIKVTRATEAEISRHAWSENGKNYLVYFNNFSGRGVKVEYTSESIKAVEAVAQENIWKNL